MARKRKAKAKKKSGKGRFMALDLKMSNEQLVIANAALHTLAKYQTDIIGTLVLREIIETIKPQIAALYATECDLDIQHAAKNKETGEPVILGMSPAQKIVYSLDKALKGAYFTAQSTLMQAEVAVTIKRPLKVSLMLKIFDKLQKIEDFKELGEALINSGPFVDINVDLDALLEAMEKAESKATANGSDAT